MGSLCCVAARPHGNGTASREWSSIGRSDPFWRTNTSFSPPLSRRWDYRIHSEGLSYGSQGDSGFAANYGSSLSSNSKEPSRSWERSELPPDHRYSTSEGAVSYFNSPEGGFNNQHSIPPPVQYSSFDQYVRVPVPEPIDMSPFSERMSGEPNSGGSTSSHSDGSEYEIPKSHSSTPRNFSSRLSFMSKPIHPFAFPEHALGWEETHGSVASASSSNPLPSEFKGSGRAIGEVRSAGPAIGGQGDSAHWSSASSVDFSDISEPPEAECSGPLKHNNSPGRTKCDLCERPLSKRPPWGSHRIVRTGEMPIAGVLPCCHVYHAECLERTTPKGQKHDPPCPACDKLAGKDTEQWSICRLKNGLPRLRSLGEGPSRVWTCAQASDCVGGAVHIPKPTSVVLLSRNRLKGHLSLKGESGKDCTETSRGEYCSPQALSGPR